MQTIEGKILNLWNISSEGSYALGPGLRYIIWTQGCLKRCAGCTSPQSQPIELRNIVEVEHLAEDIIKNEKISGITISGGEPFLQSASLARLLEIIKLKRPEINVIVFTGYLKEELKGEDAEKFLSQIDVLIDGPYCQEKKANRGLRGSINQQIHFLTPALIPYREELEDGPRKLEVHIEDNEIVTIGIPKSEQENIV